MGHRRAKRLRKNVRQLLGIRKIPRATNYQLSHIYYAEDADGREYVLSATARVHPKEPRHLYRAAKRLWRITYG